MWYLFADVAGGGDMAAWITAGTTTTATGILLLVLRWIALTHLPLKDKQITDLLQLQSVERIAQNDKIEKILDLQAKEREKDRIARHDTNNLFQELIGRIEEKHQQESDKEREAAILRSNRLEDAIKQQTVELRAEIHSFVQAACRYYSPIHSNNAPPPQPVKDAKQ